MSHTKLTFAIEPLQPWRDLLLAELAGLGYDGFEEGDEGPGARRGMLTAWIAAERYVPEDVQQLRTLRQGGVEVHWEAETVPARNWNAIWEAGFSPVEVGGSVRVRALHHRADPTFAHELVITPRMAFGTGHHATTRMMIQGMLELPLQGKQVCDMGCGTAILAMLAERLGAAAVDAVDNDPVAVENALADVAANGCTRVHVEKGDIASVRGRTYGIILANIERNTLVAGMHDLAGVLSPGGYLLLSGFIVADVPVMREAARAAGLETVGGREEGEWAMLTCSRKA